MKFRQGDIIEVDFNPTLGHEPQSRRPALVVSNDDYNLTTSMTIVCPITSWNNDFYLHEPLPEGTSITGTIALEQVRALDLVARKAKKIDQLEKAYLDPILICIQSFFLGS